ncbi:MAG: hypothetical protein RL653_2917 [Pseudomonadota bacterium]|jgi:hypothetical protein
MRLPRLSVLLLLCALPTACGPVPPELEPDAGDVPASPPDGGTVEPPTTPDAGMPGEDAGTAAPSCGDGTCAADEGCGSCAQDCGACCTNAGGLSCGGNGIGGSPDVLYRCDGTRYVPHETCSGACVVLPAGTPDRCPLGAPPASLVTRLSVTPYVEGSCQSTTWAGWPYAAKRCTYSAGGRTAAVTVANPSAEKVARWIVDASALIPRLRALQQSAPAQWEEGLGAMAQQVLLQSSRIFPLEGGILENMGSGWVNYPFLGGVTQGCSSGCFCRINSLHRTTYCAWRAAKAGEAEADCLQRVGTSGHAKWSDQCLANHVNAWEQDWNEHFRALAWDASKGVAARCPTASSCTPSEVVAAVRSAYGP